MKLELKNIKYAAFNSHETHCYSATLYVNGNRFAIVGNDGHGGCDHVDKANDKMSYAEFNSQLDAVESWLQTEDEDNRLEFECCNMVNKWLLKKEFKKHMKKIQIFDTSDECLFHVKAAPNSASIEAVKKASWYTKTCIILQELPEARALELFDKATSPKQYA